MKHTNQREAIQKALEDGHPTAQEVVARVQKSLPHTSRATIYRNLELLCKTGAVRKVEAPGPTRFELMTHKDNHDHFLCSECGNIQDICLTDARTKAREAVGDDVNITINVSGVCKNCR